MPQKINVFAQILVGQLNNLYYYLYSERNNDTWIQTTIHACPDTHLLYDELKRIGDVDMEVQPEIKDQLWRLAKIRFNHDNRIRIKMYNLLTDEAAKEAEKKRLDKELAKVYKSYLLRFILGQKLYKEDLRLNLEFEDGSKVQQLTITGR